MSQILAIDPNINIAETDIKDLLVVVQTINNENKQYVLLVILTLIYVNPYPFWNTMKINNMYEGFLIELFKINFSGKIMKKILILALTKLISIENN
jgi:hypothetical protein